MTTDPEHLEVLDRIRYRDTFVTAKIVGEEHDRRGRRVTLHYDGPTIPPGPPTPFEIEADRSAHGIRTRRIPDIETYDLTGWRKIT